MIIRNGSLFECKEGIMVHGVNCMGVMGAGIAQEVKARWPKEFVLYREKCQTSDDLLGTIIVSPLEQYSAKDKRILIHAFTQRTYGREAYASYDAIDECFLKISRMMSPAGLNKIHFPMIGCGLGKRDWSVVKAIIDLRIPSIYEKNLWIP